MPKVLCISINKYIVYEDKFNERWYVVKCKSTRFPREHRFSTDINDAFVYCKYSAYKVKSEIVNDIRKRRLIK